MRIVVDEMPKESKDCLFCKYTEHRDDSYYHGYIHKESICNIGHIKGDSFCNIDTCPYLTVKNS